MSDGGPVSLRRRGTMRRRGTRPNVYCLPLRPSGIIGLMLCYQTAGESHGKCLLALIEGIPYGTPVETGPLDAELARRQGGYGRGARQEMERDVVEILSGVRRGMALGGPIALQVANRVRNSEELGPITHPRPGHADLAGAVKFGTVDARGVSERASARETAARVAAGALAVDFLSRFGIRVLGYVVEVGGIAVTRRIGDPEELVRVRDASSFYTLDPAADGRIRALVDEVREAGDTVGGVFEVLALGVPPGLGSHATWEGRLDGALARALMSVQTVKAVEVGLGMEAARRRGSNFHDEILPAEGGGWRRSGNNAGGLEGGMTNGEPVVVRAASKPIPTLRRPLRTVDLRTGEAAEAAYERSDVCVVAAASVVGQAAVAFELARAFLEKFGGDTFEETRERFGAYRKRLESFQR